MNLIQMTQNDVAQLMQHDLKSINNALVSGESDLSSYNPTVTRILIERAETIFQTAYIGNDSFDFTLAEKTAVNDDLKSYHNRSIVLNNLYFWNQER